MCIFKAAKGWSCTYEAGAWVEGHPMMGSLNECEEACEWYDNHQSKEKDTHQCGTRN